MKQTIKSAVTGVVILCLMIGIASAETYLFRNGLAVNGFVYDGTADATMNQSGPDTAYGSAWWPLYIRAAGASMQCTTLVKFGDLSEYLPTGFLVQSARVSLSAFYDVSSTLTVSVSEMLKTWNNASLTWNVDGMGHAWASAGALGTAGNESVGPDHAAADMDAVTIAGGTVAAHDTVWFDLDPAVVQKWIYNPLLNYGLLFYSNETTSAYFYVVGRIGNESWEVNRPQLEITGFVAEACSEIWEQGLGVQMDLNHDCYIDLLDFALLVDAWLTCNDPADPACSL